MSAQDVYTDEQVAARYDKSKDYVQRKARAGTWPHLRIGRSICFTEAHVAAIEGARSCVPARMQPHPSLRAKEALGFTLRTTAMPRARVWIAA